MAEYITVEINGHELEIDNEARKSWAMFDLICEIGTQFEPSKLPLMFKLIELCCGVDKAQFIELCGGEGAPYTEVMANVAKVFDAIVPKN